jgi:hypothetical protein
MSKSTVLLLVAVVALCLGRSAQAVDGDILIIDDFEQPGPFVLITVTTATVLPVSQGAVQTGSMLGGERDVLLTVHKRTSTDGDTVEYCKVSDGDFAVSTPSDLDEINAQLQYDGVDNDPVAINPVGLGGIDLTQGGGHAFRIVVQTDHETQFVFNVFTAQGQSSQSAIVVPGAVGVSTERIVEFSSFSGNANFKSIGAITLTNNAAADTDTVVDIIATYGGVAGVTPTPSPRATAAPQNNWYSFDDDAASPCGDDAATTESLFLSDRATVVYNIVPRYSTNVIKDSGAAALSSAAAAVLALVVALVAF